MANAATTRPTEPLWGSALMALGVLLALGLVLLGAAGWWYLRQPVGQLGKSEAVAQPLGRATQAAVTLSPGAASLELTSGAGNAYLLEGTVQNLNFEQRTSDDSLEGRTLVYRLEATRPLAVREPERWPVWKLRLNPDVPVDLSVRNGLPASSLDLRGLTINRLEIDATVGRLDLTLPERGQVQARVTGGTSRTAVRVPEGVAVRVRVVRAGAGHVAVFGRVWAGGGTYASPGYEAATERVELEVAGGAARFEITRIP